MKITKLQPVGGFCAETGGRGHAVPRDEPRDPGLDDAHHHRRHRGRRAASQALRRPLGRGRRIVWAWVLTVPGAALIAALVELALMGLGLDPR